MSNRIAITAMSSISALGVNESEIWNNYLDGKSSIASRSFGRFDALCSSISDETWCKIDRLREDKNYRDLDPSVLLAIETGRRLMAKTDWQDREIGINIGSSRGATQLLEKFHEEFMANGKHRVSTLSSPTTTLGNLSSWVGHDLQIEGPTISHSIACSTALHGVLNAMAWIQSGMSDRFIAGGSEASNTAFTMAQMKALKIYADNHDEYPCRSLDTDKDFNSMVLGEACSLFALEREPGLKALAYIQGVGFATEPLKHNISISAEADCFQKSMRMALGDTDPQEIDVILTHAPGTVKGDLSEIRAIERVFGAYRPALTSNKWIIGHTLGASGAMSLEMAVLMLQRQEFVPVPFLKDRSAPNRLQRIMVNAVGFGGNAVSIVVSSK